MKKFSKFLMTVVIVIGIVVPGISAFAAKGDQGVDWAIYQGANGRFGYAHDKFMIAQIGGYNGNGLYDQWTYKTQVASAIAQGKRAHTYIWYDTWGNMSIAKTTMDYFLPKIQTPKNSIVALDFESGAGGSKQANTDTILYGMRRIKQAGYTPMYYSYKPFTLANVNYQQIIKEFPNSLWIAGYPDYKVTPKPNYAVFPSMDGIAIYQFTSTYIAGGLDGNIDLTGITDNGYKKGNEPVTETPSIEVGEEANNTPKNKIKVGDTVKVNFSAKTWATGEAIPDWVKGNTYKVSEISGDKVLLNGVMSWANRKNVEIINATDKPIADPKPNISKTHKVVWGDTLSDLAYTYGTTVQSIKSLNGLYSDMIYVGQTLKLSGNVVSSNRTHRIVWGDSLSSIAQRYGTTVQALKSLNGLTSDMIYAGNTLKV